MPYKFGNLSNCIVDFQAKYSTVFRCEREFRYNVQDLKPDGFSLSNLKKLAR